MSQSENYDCSKETVEGSFSNGDKFDLQTYFSYTKEEDHAKNAVSAMKFADMEVGESYNITSWNLGKVSLSPDGFVFLVHGDEYLFSKDGTDYTVVNLMNHVVRVTEVKKADDAPADEGAAKEA